LQIPNSLVFPQKTFLCALAALREPFIFSAKGGELSSMDLCALAPLWRLILNSLMVQKIRLSPSEIPFPKFSTSP
jgi:hypothetical protein